MDTLVIHKPEIHSAEPPIAPAVVAAVVMAQLDTLAEARTVTGWFLRTLQAVAESLTEEEAKTALAGQGQLVLGVTRIDRALRQIVAMEQEVLGLRDPAVPRGGGGERPGDGAGADRREGDGLAQAPSPNPLPSRDLCIIFFL